MSSYTKNLENNSYSPSSLTLSIFNNSTESIKICAANELMSV